MEFRNVSFCYPDSEEYVLRDISFAAKSGETVAFIGSTGCGIKKIINDYSDRVWKTRNYPFQKGQKNAVF